MVIRLERTETPPEFAISIRLRNRRRRNFPSVSIETPPEFAISIRQPWAELILRGEKLTEYRSWQLPEKYWGTWLYLHVPASMNQWEKDLAMRRLGTRKPALGVYVGLIRFGCPTRTFTPLEVEPYIQWPYCWHWPVTGVERIPFIAGKGKIRIFKVK